MRPLKEECFDCWLLHKCPSFYTPGSFLCTALQLSRGRTKLDALRRQNAKYAHTVNSVEAMQRAVAATFERSLKSDLYLKAAQKGKDDFFFLLDSNTAIIAQSILGLYQSILNEVGDVDTDFQ